MDSGLRLNLSHVQLRKKKLSIQEGKRDRNFPNLFYTSSKTHHPVTNDRDLIKKEVKPCLEFKSNFLEEPKFLRAL